MNHLCPDDVLDDVYENLVVFQQPWYQPTNVRTKCRAVLVDWMLEVFDARVDQDLRLVFLAVNLFDHHMHLHRINEAKLQLVGTAALWIGSKVYSSHPYAICELVYMAADQYTAKEIVAMERTLLLENNHSVTGSLLPDFCEASSKLQKHTLMHPALMCYSPDDLALTLEEHESKVQHPTYRNCYNTLITTLVPK